MKATSPDLPVPLFDSACDANADGLAQLAAVISNTTPGVWRAVAQEDTGLYRVESENALVETDLTRPYADYLVCLRHTAEWLLSAPFDTSRHDHGLFRQASDEFASKAQAACPTWLFVAKSAGGDRYFLHNSSVRIGAGILRKEDAAFIDVAGLGVPRLLDLVRVNDASSIGRSFPAKPPLIIPKRPQYRDAAEEYAAFADPGKDVHALAGRHDLADRTIIMIRAILDRLDIRPQQRVLDIGCGDASLLSQIVPVVSESVGTVLTDRERDRLNAAHPHKRIAFYAASFDSLEVVPGDFDCIIANGSLHFTKNATGARNALQKLRDRLRPRGRIWAGELYSKEFRTRRTFERLEAVRHVRETYGNRLALAFLRHMWRRKARANVIHDVPFEPWWHIRPDQMPAFAARCGLRVERQWSCRDMTDDSFYSLQDRFSCLLVRE